MQGARPRGPFATTVPSPVTECMSGRRGFLLPGLWPVPVLTPLSGPGPSGACTGLGSAVGTRVSRTLLTGGGHTRVLWRLRGGHAGSDVFADVVYRPGLGL